MKQFQINLRLKMFIVVGIGLLIAYGSIGVYRIYQVRKSFAGEVERSGQERASLIADAVANMIVAYDYGNLESVADRVVKLQDVQKINIFNRGGKLMVTRNSTDFKTENIDFDNPGILFVSKVVVSGDTVGSVELIVSRGRFETLIQTNYRNIMIAIVLSAIFFGFLIYTTVSILIARPLLRLSKAADQLALGNYSAELPAESRDEIGNLVRAFSSMRETRKIIEARLAAIFDNSPDAFIQLNKDGNIVNWNDKATDIFGYEKNEISGRNFSLLLPDAELGLNPGYKKCYQKSDHVIGEIREVVGKRKNGSPFPLELRTNEFQLDEGIAYLVSARDISERKENEIKLLDAMNAAEEANAAKSAFLSNISHEIRTPMNSILGMTRLAFKTQLDAKQRDYLIKIDYSAKHLMGLINDILDFSKIEAKKFELEVHNFELSKLFENLSNQLSHTAESKGLKLSLNLDPDLNVPILGDSLRLSQVLLNFGTNAIKFTDRGEISVNARRLEEDNDAYLIRFEVRDTGIGLRADEMDKLFQAFHQADASTTRRFGGTGLGLAISKQLVELMGGVVGVESTMNQGSIFWFTVRLGKGDKQLETMKHSQLDMDVLKGASILLVEDNLFNQQVGLEMLREVGANVSIANNGQEAIGFMRARHFDCVLMDVQMPVMDGLEATRKIRSDPSLKGAYIIAMTANAGREDKTRCINAGMDNFISKPISFEQLYVTIARHLESTKLNIEVATSFEANNSERANMIQHAASAGDAKQTNSDNSSVIDLSILSKMMNSDPVKVQKFALKFLSSAQQGLLEIERALQQGNLTMLAALGHRNKSPARTVGANSYAELCQSLEQFKDGGTVEDAKNIVGKMHTLLKQIEETVNNQHT